MMETLCDTPPPPVPPPFSLTRSLLPSSHTPSPCLPFPSPSPAPVVLSLRLIQNVVLQYFFWIMYPVVFVLFSVGFVQVVSTHAIGEPPPLHADMS